MERFLVVQVGGKGWDSSALVLFPFNGSYSRSSESIRRSKFKVYKGKHLLETSLKWRSQLAQDERLTTSGIVADTSLSPGRVRQILRLGTLDKLIQGTILGSQSRKHWGRFTEERLRPVVSAGPEMQVERFEEIFGVKVAKPVV